MKGSRAGGGNRLVRAYVVTGGRTAAARNHFDHITLISLSVSSPRLDRTRLTPEHRTALDLLSVSAYSVAELGAHLNLPLGVLRILLADLMGSGHITTQRTITQTTGVDTKLLEDVLAGLQRL
ncbi:DUF742 domain-containing protein [Streptomyces griseoviridis]|uniref:DUF742 domain-containing protein n=1 Tax=Streptomyces griseoviridis TaxID=45398 RepID=UPI0033DCFE03